MAFALIRFSAEAFVVSAPKLSLKERKLQRKVSNVLLGAGHELKVAADLMYRGYYVFRSLSPQCPCDMVALGGTDGRLLRIEVKGRTFICKNTRFDILANVVNGVITYTPELPLQVCGETS